MTSLGEGLPRQRTGRRVIPDGINGHVSVTKASLQFEGHWLWLNLETDGLRSRYEYFHPTYMVVTGHVFNCETTLGPHLGLIM